MKNSTSWIFLLALAAAVPVLGQDYVIPAGATNGATCGAPPFLVVTQASGVSCASEGYFHWFAVGGGWSTALTLSNPTSSDMAIQISLLDQSGNNPSPMTLVRNGSNLGAKSSDTQELPKNSSLRYELPSAGVAAQANGQILVQVLAKNGQSLQSVLASEDYTFTSDAGVVYSSVTFPIAWVDQATSTYTATFEESSANGSFGAFAIKDLGGGASGQNVDLKAYDVNGNLLGQKTLTLAAGQVAAKTTDDMFGASVFQSLSPSPVVRLQITGAGALNVLVLQVRGQSLAAMPATSVLAQ